jgi:argonaute-like protein implicated in RNA metabolism and viral defense
MKKHGPYRPPEKKHISIFFIVHADDRKRVANKLAKYLKEGQGYFQGLPRYANVPMQFMDDHIVFEDADNPLPEISSQLQTMPFKEEMQYLAIYLSPIHKDDPDPDKRTVYYRVKEELLKYQVSSQVIDRDNVSDDNFQYYLPNIAVAVLAKLGGIPWQLKHPPRRELIVGVGAFRPADKNQQYIGSAFCFSNGGTFRGFRCFSKKETRLLAGSIREAVRNYVKEVGELDRLIIHYYKKMSYREREPIVKMLHNLGLEDVTVVVVTINKTPSSDVLLFDRAYEGRMPLSGTYVRLDHHRLLLCNNTRYGQGKEPRHYPFPVKVKIESDERGFMHKDEKVQEIMQQVYQFSRIYWKSIAQQNLPVTIKYPEMVARMFPYFESDIIPHFGRHNLWFL